MGANIDAAIIDKKHIGNILSGKKKNIQAYLIILNLEKYLH
jgi:hypothetical protein